MIRTANQARVLVFDLDDTLYPEHDFVASGFQAVDEELRRKRIAGFLPVAQELFQSGLRGKIFDAVLAQLGVSSSPELIAELVQVYRSHTPRLRLYPDAKWVLEHYAGERLGLVTDGISQTQRNKVRALGLEKCFAAVVYTDELGPERSKPSAVPFQTIATMLGIEGETHRLVYVADNPSKDFLAPNQLGWTTVRIQRGAGEYSKLQPVANSYSAHHEIPSLEALPQVLHD